MVHDLVRIILPGDPMHGIMQSGDMLGVQIWCGAWKERQFEAAKFVTQQMLTETDQEGQDLRYNKGKTSRFSAAEETCQHV